MSTDLTLSKLAGPLIKVAISLAKMFQKLMKEFKNYGFKKYTGKHTLRICHI